jgi:uncharacterized membrane protein required for colicin V production
MWSNVVALLIIVAVIWLESVRGFGRALFDVVGAIIALRISLFLAKPLALAAPMLAGANNNEAFWLAVSFVVLMVLVVIASRFLYETTLLSLDVLDPVVGGIFGAVTGMVAAHIFLRALLLSYGDSDAGKLLLDTFMGQELLQFRAFHTVVTALRNLGNW